MTQMVFITLEQFKAVKDVEKVDIAFNQASGKTFGIHSKGTVKVQQDLNPALPIRYMHEVDKFEDGCIINVKPIDIKFSL
jgi:hypothetical protein